MTIVLEGPPAAGKSTISRSLQSAGDYYVIPEVNMLFQRPQLEPENWYLDRQVCRWEIGMRQEESYSGVIFDGDIFQPLWFNWIFSDEDWNPLEHNEAYYRKAIMVGRIRFPGRVQFLRSTTPEATITAITEAQIAPKSPSDITIFDFLIDWLRNNEAEPTSVANGEQARHR